jgi:hypothetical protein
MDSRSLPFVYLKLHRSKEWKNEFLVKNIAWGKGREYLFYCVDLTQGVRLMEEKMSLVKVDLLLPHCWVNEGWQWLIMYRFSLIINLDDKRVGKNMHLCKGNDSEFPVSRANFGIFINIHGNIHPCFSYRLGKLIF